MALQLKQKIEIGNSIKLINDKDYKDISLWEDYLIYSVIFGHNKQIVDEILNKAVL